MKLSQGVEWALHYTALIALAPPDVAVSRRVLADHYGLPDAYLAKHLQAMVRAGLLRATSGPNGGFRLARPADEITALDIVDAVEGSASPFTCQEIRQSGSGALRPEECRRPCGMSTVMGRAHQAWRESLRSVTVTDLVATTPRRIRERNREKLAAAHRA